MIKSLFKKRKTALPVKESIETVNTMVENRLAKHGWKYLKSSRKHKKLLEIYPLRFVMIRLNGITKGNLFALNGYLWLIVENIKYQVSVFLRILMNP